MTKNAEQRRLSEYRDRKSNWKHWGPYLSERGWGTVREDYSPTGEAWDYFPHDHARSRVYRWNEDGLAGISDRNQYLCFGLALWNGQDEILKERMFGLTGVQGNHGEDVKEYWFYLDSTPTHSYMKLLYKYPQAPFPYEQLVDENARRGYQDPEFELLDTGIFEDSRYFDVFVEYAKGDQDDILIRITAHNRGDEPAPLHLLPTLWFRNTWSWGYSHGPLGDVPNKPRIYLNEEGIIQTEHDQLDPYQLFCDGDELTIFTENETNMERLFGSPNRTPFVKDAFHRHIINHESGVVNPTNTGTKCAVVYEGEIAPGESNTIRLRLTNLDFDDPFADFDALFEQRVAETDEFYAEIQKVTLSEDERNVQRQAFAGMMWTKQLYYYDIHQWLKGDPVNTPPPGRKNGRNRDWEHLVNFDIISMPDKWEYPWYATWDLAFHTIPIVLVDPDFAKRQLTLMTREWYMHPNGQLPAYEWAFGDVNPPVHAWAAWRVYHIDAIKTGERDRNFLEGIFQKLMLNFTWWVNRKDVDGNNIFQGGFLGLDNISVFDRSKPLPTGGHIDQSDGTAWMGAYCLQLLQIALELAKENRVYEDMATKLFEHFLRIASAMNARGDDEHSLWDEEDGFFYDWLHSPHLNQSTPLKVRSLVGLLPLFAVQTFEDGLINDMPTFRRRMEWFLENRPNLTGSMIGLDDGIEHRRIAALVTPNRLKRVLAYMLDENEFLSDYGIRSVSKIHEKEPFTYWVYGEAYSVPYWPAESQSGLFGGNSNWRGPIWFPINYLIIESLQKYYHFFGEEFKVEMPTGSGHLMTLDEICIELSKRLTRIFLKDEEGHRPNYGGTETFQIDPNWKDYILFHEYFHGDNGAGIGASHQTGWTGLVAELLQQVGGEKRVTDDRMID